MLRFFFWTPGSYIKTSAFCDNKTLNGQTDYKNLYMKTDVMQEHSIELRICCFLFGRYVGLCHCKKPYKVVEKS